MAPRGHGAPSLVDTGTLSNLVDDAGLFDTVSLFEAPASVHAATRATVIGITRSAALARLGQRRATGGTGPEHPRPLQYVLRDRPEALKRPSTDTSLREGSRGGASSIGFAAGAGSLG